MTRPRGRGVNARAIARQMRRRTHRIFWGNRVPLAVTLPLALVDHDPYPGDDPVRPGWELQLSHGSGPDGWDPAEGNDHEFVLPYPDDPSSYTAVGWSRWHGDWRDPTSTVEWAKATESEARLVDARDQWERRVLYGYSNRIPVLLPRAERDRLLDELRAPFHPVIRGLWDEPGSKAAWVDVAGDELTATFSVRRSYITEDAAWLRRFVRLGGQHDVPVRHRVGWPA